MVEKLLATRNKTTIAKRQRDWRMKHQKKTKPAEEVSKPNCLHLQIFYCFDLRRHTGSPGPLARAAHATVPFVEAPAGIFLLFGVARSLLQITSPPRAASDDTTGNFDFGIRRPLNRANDPHARRRAQKKHSFRTETCFQFEVRYTSVCKAVVA
jgi:hypothetical protein